MRKLERYTAIATIIGVIIAAIALIPAFGEWLFPHEPTSIPLTYTPTTIAKVVEVSSTQGWQSSGIMLQQGQRFKIEYISGQWTSHTTMTDAYGEDYICGAESCCEPLPREHKGALIGKIGNEMFFVGNGGSFTASSKGILSLRINDCDTDLGDNTGSVRVGVEIGD